MKNSIFNSNFFLKLVIPTFFFLLWFFLIGKNFINEFFLIDDYHWLREFDYENLKNVWYNNWDPDNIETSGYRPAALYLYHLQGILFDENNFVAYHLFSIALMFVLLLTVIQFLNLLNFTKYEICFFSLIFIYSKIFTTLAAWITINPLIVCYIFFFLTGIFFIKWTSNFYKKYYILILFFSIFGVLIREEIYHVPIFLFLTWIYKSSIKEFQINIKKVISICAVIFAFFLFLYFLRSVFISNAPQPNFRIDNILSFLITGVASGLPGGVFTYTFEEKLLQFFWIIGLFVICLTTIINKNYNFFFLKKIFVLFSLVCLTSLPSSVMARDFGILLPTIFSYMIITKIIFNFYNSSIKINYKFFIIFFVIISGVFGGYQRSIQHLHGWSFNSSFMVWLNSEFLYGRKDKKFVTIPEKRKKLAIVKLKNLGIDNRVDNYDDILQLIKEKKVSSDIYIPRHFFLKH
jgi:hypothetical protein